MSYRVSVTSKARQLIEDLDAWWAQNRPASASKVNDEVGRALLRLGEMPATGGIYVRRDGDVIRRMRLGATPYFLYYLVDEAAGEVVVISAWSSERRSGPRL